MFKAHSREFYSPRMTSDSITLKCTFFLRVRDLTQRIKSSKNIFNIFVSLWRTKDYLFMALNDDGRLQNDVYRHSRERISKATAPIRRYETMVNP